MKGELTGTIMARIGLVGMISAFLAWLLSGCVTMTRRDFELFKMGWRSVGYMEGLSASTGIWMTSLEKTETELAECREKAR